MRFTGDNRFLSNMFPCDVEYEGMIFHSVEAAFQAAKTENKRLRTIFQDIPAADAKRKGRRIRLRDNWDTFRLTVMRELIEKKFSQKWFKEKLDRIHEPIVEDNTWGDHFWGVCNGVGLNVLGKMIEEQKEKKMKTYAGVGSRKVPKDIADLMMKAANVLEHKGYLLYSGGAAGADTAFASGTSKKKIFCAEDSTPKSEKLAESFHPAWSSMGEYARKLHGRNSFQVLGEDLNSPVDFVICWTPDGCISHKNRTRNTGGTGTAISIADANGIPVFNLARPDHLKRIYKMVTDFELENV